MTALEVVVRGRARRKYAAERATVAVTATLDDADRTDVYRRAVALQDRLITDLRGLCDAGAVNTWSSDQLRVFSYRPYSKNGRAPLAFRVDIRVEAEFADFEQLSTFLDRWAVEDGVEIGRIDWDVTEVNRQTYEAELCQEAVRNAAVKARAFAEAAGRGEVTAVQLADPGMLQAQAEYDGPRVMAMAAPAGGAGGGPTLDLRPDDITIGAAVDAKFVAE
ncbi:hypothetical protein BOO86_28625 [Mycobacterium sp. CBMA 234]|uniref:SIMPL domain-containing protein n=1 Tax=Mycolicibacterium sp. CBMA 234 TaxID=1918495 RepID=UPI0012DFC5E7|nr:SIMPL domain-containing protein [Mycolicibacterium sp. CBMA 234]MUL68466.1 hypothetical protein [Mycolicibacterium sp. CBMA 234]